MIDKEIIINNNRTLRLNIDKSINITTIDETFFKDGEFEKAYHLTQSADYLFTAFVKNDNNEDISFEFSSNHPLYFSLLHLLNNEKRIIIEDDGIKEYNVKYLEISEDDDKIIMNYVNRKDDKNSLVKYNILIKSILYNNRSKIDINNMDTKIRLLRFFRESSIELIQGYHQIEFNDFDKQLSKKIKY